MSTIALSMSSPASAKRSYDVADLSYVDLQSEDSEGKHTMAKPSSTPGGLLDSSAQMPLLPSIETDAFARSTITSSISVPATTEKPVKRPKLSTSEKEAKRIEKEAKDRQKAEEKAKKDIERAKKDAEKAAKDEERRKVKEAKDEQARTKEEEKRKKEDERMKKARSQLRLNAFFHQHSNPDNSVTRSPSKPPASGDRPSPLSSRRSSISEMNATESDRRTRSISAQGTPSKPRLPDYKRHFPQFFIQSHTVLAPQNRFARDTEGLLRRAERIDEAISKTVGEDPSTNQGLDDLHLYFKRSKRTPPMLSVKEAINSAAGSSANPIDVMGVTSSTGNPRLILGHIAMKFLRFAEDVRPPYIGTYSKTPIKGSISSLARNPLGRVRPDTNYDYDSEAEWEDPIDGEDLNSEGEEEEEDEDEGEMEGFLDDEEPNAVRRRPLLGDQEPICSGICWEGESHSSNGSLLPDLNPYRIDVLLENPRFPIDPFSTTYWVPSQSEKTSTICLPNAQTTLMEPPRIPLSPINRTNTLLKRPPINPTTNQAPKAPKRFVDLEILEEFKQAIVGSDLTKMGLCEILKKRFPKQKKDAIKDTLEAVAERVGEKAADKRWVLKSGV